MAELSLDDARLFNGRFDDFDDDALQAMLNAALAAARRYCGWSVTPSATVTLELDGPGGRVLPLPTLKLTTLTSVTENGVVLDVSTLQVSKRLGLVEKAWPQCWTHKFGSIVVAMTHGFTETEAADWRRAVLRLVNLMSREPTADAERDSPEMKRKRIDDVDYEWYDKLITTNEQLAALFAQYRILPSP